MAYSTLSTLYEDSRIWTFSLTVSAGLIGIVIGAVSTYLATHKSDTSSKQDIP